MLTTADYHWLGLDSKRPYAGLHTRCGNQNAGTKDLRHPHLELRSLPMHLVQQPAWELLLQELFG